MPFPCLESPSIAKASRHSTVPLLVSETIHLMLFCTITVFAVKTVRKQIMLHCTCDRLL